MRPKLVNTRTEVLSNWRFCRRLSCLELSLRNMGRSRGNTKVAHERSVAEITKGSVLAASRIAFDLTTFRR